MLPETWFPLRPHAKQDKLWRTKARFVAVAAGRGSGKTEISRRRCIAYLAHRKPWDNPIYGYIVPTTAQARKIAWEPLKALMPKEWYAKPPNESEMYIETVFGSRLYVLSGDKPERIEGLQYDGVVIDESSDQRPTIFSKSVLPALSHRKAWCWRIGVPKHYGIGAVDFKKFFDDIAEESYTWPSEDILTPDEIALHKSMLDERDYNEQYRAKWGNSSGAIFHAFNESINVRPVSYSGLLPLVVGSDFNVDPMSWVLGHVIQNELHIFDELFIRNTNTQETLNILWNKYKSHSGGWEFFGDAAARARKTSATESDYALIKNDKRFHPAKVFYLKSNPRVRDRFAACNALFRNAEGLSRCFIDPRCKHLIDDLKIRSWEPGTLEPDDYGDIGHISDALGYIIHRRWPVSINIDKKVPEISTHAFAR